MTIVQVLVTTTDYTENTSLTFEEYLLGKLKICGPKILSRFLLNILNFSSPKGGATYLQF